MTTEIAFLERVLTDNSLFKQIIQSENKEETVKKIDSTINVDELFTPVNLAATKPSKLWQIFSRIRFEYVKPDPCFVVSPELSSLLPSMPIKEKLIGLKSYFLESLNYQRENAETFLFAEPGTVRQAMIEYYQKNNVNESNPYPMFPFSYILIHDFHHVLLDLPVTIQGELEIIAFEEGMINRCQPPLLLLEQLEIFLSSKGINFVNSQRLCKAWTMGVNAPDIFTDFPISYYLDKDLDQVRYLLNVSALN